MYVKKVRDVIASRELQALTVCRVVK